MKKVRAVKVGDQSYFVGDEDLEDWWEGVEMDLKYLGRNSLTSALKMILSIRGKIKVKKLGRSWRRRTSNGGRPLP